MREEVVVLNNPIDVNKPQERKSDSLSIGLEPENFNDAYELLESKGMMFMNIIDDKATRLAYFSDPDGNPLYLFEIKSEAGVPESIG